MKIVLIGAGSKDFGRGQVVDLMSSKDLVGQNVTFMLVDMNEQALAVMARFAQKMKEHFASDVKIETETDRTKALPGADYVITSVARKRMELWEQDFRIPLSYGFRHVLGENGGPGALFHALRSFELVIPICRDIEALCPKATLLNFTNPEARVLHAISTLTNVKAYGICHGFFSARDYTAKYLNRPAQELEVTSAGMNHIYQVLSVKDKKTGEELFPQVLAKAKADAGLPPLFRKLVEIFDVLTYCSDDHFGEYLSFGSEFAGIKWHYGQECKKVTLQPSTEVPRPVLLEEYANGKRPMENWMAERSGETTIPMICDILHKRKARHPAVNVLNKDLFIENLPVNGVVEIPTLVDGDGIHPIKVGTISEPLAAIYRTQYAIHNLLTEAYKTRSKRLLLQALLLDPVVNSVTAAEKMLDEMLKLQEEFLPKFE